ncbi:MAG: metal ABC transporter permease [Anaerolineae bacterium]|nr:metal ABC transporter permease [Anaerolineae bacterium]
MSDLSDLLLEPLRYSFMLRGLVAVVLVGLTSAVVGSYVVLRRMAFFGDALAHAILPGVAIGYIVGGGERGVLFWWGLLAAVVTSVAIGAVTRGGQVKEDAAIGIIFAGMFALGIAIMSTARSYAVDLAHFLFGNVLGVAAADLARTAAVAFVVLVVTALFYKEFLLLSFDSTLAITLRLPVRFLDNLLLILVAVTIVASLQTVGVALMVAMLVAPATTGFLLARRLPGMMAVAAAVGAASGIVGLYLSYYAAIASGAAIVLVSIAAFLLAFLFSPRKGWFWRHSAVG